MTLKGISLGVALVALLGSANASGTYTNPVLPGDYSDPDAIRVGQDFYLVSSSFANAPGLPILHSRDLVHWQIIGHALPKLYPLEHYSVPRHGGGVWAPAIRHHNGKFVIYYPDPDFGIFRVEASDPAGPWSDPVLVDGSKGAIDPCPFWDDDGSGWLVHAWAGSRAGFNNVITLKRLNADGTKTIGEALPVIDGNNLPPVETSNGMMPWLTTEGPKLYKRNGWYYIFVPSGSVPGGWQGVFRSRKIAGPYEGRDVLDQGSTAVNGPHQGAWVTTVSGQDWFLHFQDTGTYGRRVWLEPMVWKNDWPVIGRERGASGRGEPVRTWRIPKTETSGSDVENDEFDLALSKQWQWNANPRDDWADLKTSSGALHLKSASFPVNLWENGAVLTRKLLAERFTVTTKVTFSPQAIGERTGLVMYGKDYAWVGLENTAGGLRLVSVIRQKANENAPETELVVLSGMPRTVYLRLSGEPVSVPVPPPGFTPYWPSMLKALRVRVRFSYSLDNVTFVPVGEVFEASPGVWVGGQIGLFAQAPSGTPAFTSTRVGGADYDWVRFGD